MRPSCEREGVAERERDSSVTLTSIRMLVYTRVPIFVHLCPLFSLSLSLSLSLSHCV
jgi:hypothetical protein